MLRLVDIGRPEQAAVGLEADEGVAASGEHLLDSPRRQHADAA
jgi:hypothetical protein